MKNKKLYLILGMFAVIFTFFGGTLSFLQWRTSSEQETEVVFTVNQDFMCSADGGGNITNNDAVLMPTSGCLSEEYAIQRTITVNPTLNSDKTNLTMDLWLDINDIGSGLSNSENFRYVLTTKENSCINGVVNYGTFTGKTTGDKIQLLDTKMYSTSMTDTYYLYIWIDSDETSHDIVNQTIDLSLNGSCTGASKGEPFYAVYSADDTSLRFYKEQEGVIVEGQPYEGRTATNVYKAYENDVYTYDSSTDTTTSPWDEVRENVTTIVIEDEILPHSTFVWFYKFLNTKNINVTNLNTSNTVDMYKMFDRTGYDVTEFTITGLNNWDTSNVKNMGAMFQAAGYSATTWNIGDLSNWDTENVVEMRYMFSQSGYTTTSWSIGDLSNWNVSNVADTIYMFNRTGYNSEEYTIGNIGNWDVSNIMNMQSMFLFAGENATTWYIGDLSTWNTENVSTLKGMFNNAAKKATIFNIGNIGNWNTSYVKGMNSMFQETGVNATEWYIGDLSNWDVSNVTTMGTMFYYAGKSSTTWNIGDLSNWDVSNVENMRALFCGAGFSATSFSLGDLSKWNTSSAVSMYVMFANAGYSDPTWSLDLSKWNVDNVIGYSSFAGGTIIPPVWVNEDQGDVL